MNVEDYLEEMGVMRVPCESKYIVTLKVIESVTWNRFKTITDEESVFEDRQTALDHLKSRLRETMQGGRIATSANVREYFETLNDWDWNYIFNIDRCTINDKQLWN